MLTSLFAELEQGLTATFEAAGQKITFGIGAKEIARHDAPPRIIWVPADAQHSATEKSRTNPRQVLTRDVGIVAHCWGEDLDATEALVHALLYQRHKSTWGSITMRGEEWPEDAHVESGLVALVRFSVKVPVEAKALQRARISTIAKDTTGAAPGDRELQWGEP